MTLKIAQKYISLILIIMASMIMVGIILATLKNLVFFSPIEKAKENAHKQVLRDEKGNPIISQDRFEQYLLVENPRYQIIYQKSNDTFLISINDSPFEKVRKEAEKAFLSLTNAPEKIACQLKVKVITPYFANPELAGQVFNLSFCKPR